jgi:DNA-binding NarL/FixJ family response regulator
MSNQLKILLADDHATVRQGLKLLIDSQSAIQQAEQLKPDIVVMDVSMPGMSGLVATRLLKRAQPEIAIVALTRHDDDSALEELLRAGASGYILKQSAPLEFLQAIRAIAAGGVYIDPAMTTRVADGLLASGSEQAIDQRRAQISDRETEVLRLIAVGHSNKEVAGQLKISVKTVEVHRTNAMRKLGLRGRVDIVRYGVLQGWLYDS